MQPRSNSNEQRFTPEKGKALAGTIVIYSFVTVMLLLVSFSTPQITQPDEGLFVNFGVDETGSGLIEPSALPTPVEASVPEQTPQVTSKPVEEALLSENNKEAPPVKKVDPEAEKKRLEKIEADKILKAEREADRIRKQQEEIERQKIAAEQQRETNIRNKTKNALANSKNAGTNSTSEGIAGGTGNQGVPTGSVESTLHAPGGGTGTGGNGISYDLSGRGVQKLPDPVYKIQVEGRVVVEISVDKAGKVIQAIPGVKGSTTLDENLLKVAKDAALGAQFVVKADAPEVQKGTITYNFKFR